METCQIHHNTEEINGEQTDMLLETQTEDGVRWAQVSPSEKESVDIEIPNEQTVESQIINRNEKGVILAQDSLSEKETIDIEVPNDQTVECQIKKGNEDGVILAQDSLSEKETIDIEVPNNQTVECQIIKGNEDGLILAHDSLSEKKPIDIEVPNEQTAETQIINANCQIINETCQIINENCQITSENHSEDKNDHSDLETQTEDGVRNDCSDSTDQSLGVDNSTENIQEHVENQSDFVEHFTENIENNAPDLFEGTSYHELRCLSNEEHSESITHFLPMDCNEFGDFVKDQASLDYRYRRFYRNYPENGTAQCIENTDDQLFIEIVKEEISLNPDPDEETSIFDSISFNIEDNADSMTTIKVSNTDDDVFKAESSKYLLYRQPPVITPEVSKGVRIKERRRRHRKPEGLANYRSLITEAINSSPDKRLILTDIYKYITEHVPFFKEGESGDREGWKNCVRHTLSVNERFMRVRNRDNGRSSYWTVCEEGEFDTKFADLPWVSEIYKPEERKRGRPKKELALTLGNEKNEFKEPPLKQAAKATINGKLDAKKVKKKEIPLKKMKVVENPKPSVKIKEKNLKAKPSKSTENGRRQKINTEKISLRSPMKNVQVNNSDKISIKSPIKKVQKEKKLNKIISRKIHKTKKNVKKKVLPKTKKQKIKKAGTKNLRRDAKDSNKSQDNDKAEIRRSSRNKAVRNCKN